MTKKEIKEIASIHHFLIYWKGRNYKSKAFLKFLFFSSHSAVNDYGYNKKLL